MARSWKRRGITQEEYGRHANLSFNQVRNLLYKGVIVKFPDNSIDRITSDKKLAKYQEEQRVAHEALVEEIVQETSGLSDAAKREPGEPRVYDLAHQKARREYLAGEKERLHAEKFQLEIDALHGNLVNREVERRTWFGAARALRDTLQTAGQRLAPLVVDAVLEAQSTGSDPQRAVYQLIRAEHDDALSALATEMENHGISA